MGQLLHAVPNTKVDPGVAGEINYELLLDNKDICVPRSAMLCYHDQFWGYVERHVAYPHITVEGVVGRASPLQTEFN